MEFQFKKAAKHQSKARVCLIGPPKAGKTYTALQIAQGLAGIDGRVAVIDTENGSASKYANEFAFDVLELQTYEPLSYVQAIAAAERTGYDVLIVDSASPAWAGKGGILEMKDTMVEDKRRGQDSDRNEFSAWSKINPAHNAFVDALARCRCHLVVTLRSKVKYAIEPDPKRPDRTRVVRLGERPIQRDGFDYEFDVTAEIDSDHHLRVTGTRCRALEEFEVTKPGPELGKLLAVWLADGSAPEPERPEADLTAFEAATSKLIVDFPAVTAEADSKKRIEQARLLARAGYVDNALTQLRALYSEQARHAKSNGAPKASKTEPPGKVEPATKSTSAPEDPEKAYAAVKADLAGIGLSDAERDVIEEAGIQAAAGEVEAATASLRALYGSLMKSGRVPGKIERTSERTAAYHLEGAPANGNGHAADDKASLAELRALATALFAKAWVVDKPRTKTARALVGPSSDAFQQCEDASKLLGAIGEFERILGA